MLKLYYPLIRLTTVFLFINTVIDAIPTVPVIKDVDYYCDGVVFSSSAVQSAINAHKTGHHGSLYRTTYHGPYYVSQSLMKVFPIMKDGHIYNHKKDAKDDGYFVIFDLAGVPKDMIVRIMPNKPKICSKMSASLPHLPSDVSLLLNPNQATQEPSNMYGYMCGENFFSNLFISKVIGHEKQKYGKNKSIPKPAFDPLYSQHHQSLIWSIYDEKNLQVADVRSSLIYYITIRLNGEIVLERPETMKGSLIRCAQTAETYDVQPMPGIRRDPLPEPYYECDNFLFEKSYIFSERVKAVKILGQKMLPVFPHFYTGSGFLTKTFMWPVYPSRGSFGFDDINKWYLSMDTETNVKCVAIYVNNIPRCCGLKRFRSSGPKEVVVYV